MAVADLDQLTADDVRALPVPDLAMSVLVSWYETGTTRPRAWSKAQWKRLGKDDTAVLALQEAITWLLSEGYLSWNFWGDSENPNVRVSRRGRQALGVPE